MGTDWPLQFSLCCAILTTVFKFTGSKIYGRISLNEASGLGRRGKGYALATEKVYLCTGVGEYIPSYDPLKNKFGCMAKSLYLEHQLKVLVSRLCLITR